MYTPEETKSIIVLQEGHASGLELLQSGLPDLFIVILPLRQGLAGDIVFACDLWRIEGGVIHSSRRSVHPSVRDALQDNVSRGVEVHYHVDWDKRIKLSRLV